MKLKNHKNRDMLIMKIQLMWIQNPTLMMDAVTAASQEIQDLWWETHDQTSQTLLAGCSLAELSLAKPSLTEPSLAKPSLAELSLAKPSHSQLAEYN